MNLFPTREEAVTVTQIVRPLLSPIYAPAVINHVLIDK